MEAGWREGGMRAKLGTEQALVGSVGVGLSKGGEKQRSEGRFGITASVWLGCPVLEAEGPLAAPLGRSSLRAAAATSETGRGSQVVVLTPLAGIS